MFIYMIFFIKNIFFNYEKIKVTEELFSQVNQLNAEF